MADQKYFVTALQELQDDGEEEEEAPSLCDLPLTGAGAVGEQSNERRRSLSDSAEFFEFFMPNLNISSYTFSWNDLVWPSFSSTADEDIIISEQLRNLTSTPPSPPPSLSLLPPPCSSNSVSRSTNTRSSECLKESKIVARSSSARSLNHCRNNRDLLSNRSNRMNSGRYPSDRANNNSGAQRRSPPWYSLALGPLRFPPAAQIDLRRGNKRRQSRSTVTLFPAGEKASCDRTPWKLISALSCKSQGSVAVTRPFHPYP